MSEGSGIALERLAYRVHTIGVYFRETRDARLPAVAETIRRQLAGFESTDAMGVAYRLVIADYDQMPSPDAPQAVVPNYAQYRDGLFVSPRERLALRRSGTTLSVWATRRSPVAVTYLLQELLLAQGRTMAHAAGVSVAGRGVLFPALGGVGKTAVVAHLLERPDVRLLGDDYVVLGRDGDLWGIPVPFTLYPYHRTVFPEFFRAAPLRILPGRLPFRVLRRALDALGLWGALEPRLPVEYAVVPAHRLYAPARLERAPVPVDAVYLLLRVRGLGEIRLRPADVEEVSTFVGNVLLYEWGPLLRMLIARQTLSGASLGGYLHQVTGIVRQGLEKARRLGVIEIPLELAPHEVGPAVAALSLAAS